MTDTPLRSSFLLASLFCFQPAFASELHDAVRADDAQAVLKLLDADADLEESDYMLGTPLHIAVSEGRAGMIELLVDRGADIEAKSELQGMRSLHLAAQLGELQIVETLLKQGADVNSGTDADETVLHLATKAGNLTLIRLLIDRGAKINAKENSRDFTPLMIASLRGDLETTKLLIESGADIEATSNSGRTAFYLATAEESLRGVGSDALIRYFAAQGADLEKPDDAGVTALEKVRSRNSPEWDKIAELLQELGATR